MNNKPIHFPQSWDAVIWSDFAKFRKLCSEAEDMSDRQFQAEALSIFTGLPIQVVKDLEPTERIRLTNEMSKLTAQPFNETPENSFNYNNRLFSFRIGTFAQFDRLEEIHDKNPYDPTPAILATFFVEQKDENPNWLEKVYKAISKTDPNRDLYGYAERLDIIKSLSVQKVMNLNFFLSSVLKSSKNHTTAQFLVGLLTAKIAQTKAALQANRGSGRLGQSPAAWLRHGVARLTIFSIETRLKSSHSLNGKLTVKNKGKSKTH